MAGRLAGCGTGMARQCRARAPKSRTVQARHELAPHRAAAAAAARPPLQLVEDVKWTPKSFQQYWGATCACPACLDALPGCLRALPCAVHMQHARPAPPCTRRLYLHATHCSTPRTCAAPALPRPRPLCARRLRRVWDRTTNTVAASFPLQLAPGEAEAADAVLAIGADAAAAGGRLQVAASATPCALLAMAAAARGCSV